MPAEIRGWFRSYKVNECLYEKVIKVKADVAGPSLFFFSDNVVTSRVAWRAVKGAGFWPFILILDSSPRLFIIDRGTKLTGQCALILR
jgi:hypothetical protein